jgi:prefoldin alpha subunit
MSADHTKGVNEKLDEYSLFVSETLKPNLNKALRAQDESQNELDEFVALQNGLLVLEERMVSLTLKADLGHERVYCKAEVHDGPQLFVDVGFGFHVELTRDEAACFIQRRINHLSAKLEQRQLKVRKMAEHLTSVQQIIRKLGDYDNLNRS